MRGVDDPKRVSEQVALSVEGATSPSWEPDVPQAGGAGAGERSIANLLRGGVTLATILLVISSVASLAFDLPLGDRSLPFGELFDGSHGWIPVAAQLGFLALAATPLLRVALAALVFSREGETGQATVAAGVLSLLLLSMLLGAG